MTRTSLGAHNCSLARTVDIIGDKWALMILRNAFYGMRTFSAFQIDLGVAKSVLADRLKRLVDGRILEKVQSREGVERHEYRLTAAGGDLFPIVIGLVQWGDRWVFGPGREPMTILDRESGRPVQQVAVQSPGGRTLGPRDVTFATDETAFR